MKLIRLKKPTSKVVTTDIEKPSLFRRDRKELLFVVIGGTAIVILMTVILRSAALTNQFIAVDSSTTNGVGNFRSVNSASAAGGSYVEFIAPPPPPPAPPPPPPPPTPPPPAPTPVPPPVPTTHSFYFSPAIASVLNGSNTTLTVRLVPAGQSIDILDKVTVTFDPAKLEYVSIDPTGTPFEAELTPAAITSGKIVVSRATFGAAVTADSLVFKVTFKALSGSGTANVAVAGQAASSASGGLTNPAGSSATITLTN